MRCRLGRTQWARAGTSAPAARRRGTAISNLSVNRQLRTIEDFFTAPNLDPLSECFEVYSLTSGIEFVVDEVADEPRVSHVDVTLRDRSRVRVEAIPPEADPTT